MSVWIFHRGALGDSVLLWPCLRALRARGEEVHLVGEAWAVDLASRHADVRAHDQDSPPLRALWTGEGGVIDARATHAIDFVGGSEAWRGAAARAFPGARLDLAMPRLDRVRALELARGVEPDERRWMPAPRHNPAGPVVLWVGAGSLDRLWELDRWLELGERVRADGRAPLLAAGEAERAWSERGLLGRAWRQRFEGAGGAWCDRVADIEHLLGPARLVVSADTGPGHLAAGMGVPTLQLFGASDPERWSAIGPRVDVVCAGGDSRERGMRGVGVDEVWRVVARCLRPG